MAEQDKIHVPQNILDDNHLAMIYAALQIKELAQKHLNDAKNVGFDTRQLQKTFDDSMAKLLAIKHTYFPGR